ncbi:MAG: capsular exopolysaccharide synthesis family protein [Planctomycetota bacterium]|jgi:capsular exopolysaccharide synthesis family protein
MSLFGTRTNVDELEPAPPGEGREVPIRSEELVMVQDPHSTVAEQFRRLRNSIQALNPDGAARSVLLTSAVEGEGKSVASLNLGLAMAELPHLRVLVVDGDFRNPSVERYVGLPRRLGFSDLLSGRLTMDQAIRSTSVERFDVMGAGRRPDNPAEVLNVDRVRAVLNALKRRYDFVLIDSPSVLAVNHPSVFGAIVDGIVLVLRLGKTPKQLVEEAYSMLESMGGNVLGTCVTGVDAEPSA